MKNNPKVCVLMPVYNGAATIELALKSLVAQSYTNWICVIVNDGSKDGTKEILDSLKDTRFKVYHLPQNRGRGYARQFALEHAEGDYLTYLDADDFYHCDKIKKQVQILEGDKSIYLVSGGILAFGNDFKPLNVRGCYSLKKSGVFRDGDRLPIVMPSSMIRLDKARGICYNDKLNAGEDVDYFSRYLNGWHYSNLSDVLLYYYVGPTTYAKILEYTRNEIKRGCFLTRRNLWAGARLFLGSSLKFMIYALCVPFLGVGFFLRKRGKPTPPDVLQEFHNQLTEIRNEAIA